MKKLICVFLAFALVFSLFGCSDDSLIKHNKRPEALAEIKKDLNVEVTNDNYNSEIYLTKDKFIFVSKDNSSSFGSLSTPYFYDLKTNNISRLFDFDCGDFSILMATESKLYISIYTYTEYEDSEWGYCLVEYDLASGETRKIYETPNTVYWISSAIIDDTLVYCASSGNQDLLDDESNMPHEIHAIKNGKDSVIKKDIIAEYANIESVNGKNYLELSDKTDERELYEIKEDLSIERSDEEIDFEAEEYTASEQEEIDKYVIDGKFGDWYIVNDGEKNIKEFDNGSDYSINYYLYNTKTNEATMLTTAYFTSYYV